MHIKRIKLFFKNLNIIKIHFTAISKMSNNLSYTLFTLSDKRTIENLFLLMFFSKKN